MEADGSSANERCADMTLRVSRLRRASSIGLMALFLCVGAHAAAASTASTASTVAPVAAASPGSPTSASEYSAAALYNLANSYARQGKPALAVLNYERARLLAPRDPDIRANLRYVREASGLPAQSANWFERNARIAAPNTMFWLGLFGLAVAAASLLVSKRHSTHRFKLRVLAAAGLSLAGLSLCDALATWPAVHQAVVMRTTQARVSPVTQGDPLFSLKQAQIVALGEGSGDFVLVRSREGGKGWVARADLAPVVPTPPAAPR